MCFIFMLLFSVSSLLALVNPPRGAPTPSELLEKTPVPFAFAVVLL